MCEILHFLRTGELPEEEKRARKVALQAPLFTLEEAGLFYLDPEREHRKRVVVPSQLQWEILEENHRSQVGGHF